MSYDKFAYVYKRMYAEVRRYSICFSVCLMVRFKDTIYKSMSWQPRMLDCHIHDTQYDIGIIEKLNKNINIYIHIDMCEIG